MSRDTTWPNQMYANYNKVDEAKQYEIEIEDDRNKKEKQNITEKKTRINIPRVIRNIQISYNDAKIIYMDEVKEFFGFAFTSEKVEEYPE